MRPISSALPTSPAWPLAALALVAAIALQPRGALPPVARAIADASARAIADAIAAWTAPSVAAPAPLAIPASFDGRDGRSKVTNWQSSLAAFDAEDRAAPAAPGGIVVVGSSSIRYWSSLKADFAKQRIVQRGFGGSTLADVDRYVDRLVLPHRPRTVVVYAGDNDIGGGASPEAVLASWRGIVAQVHAALPETRLVFVSIKPSPARAALEPRIAAANALVADWSRRDPRLAFVDVHAPMLDAAGHARAELFREDGLHLNAAGYALWRERLAPRLD